MRALRGVVVLPAAAVPAAVLLTAALLTAAVARPALAQQRPPEAPPAERFREELDRGLERLLAALRALMQAIPNYAAPEVNENGDIIIRRLRPPGEDRRPEPPPEVEKTST